MSMVLADRNMGRQEARGGAREVGQEARRGEWRMRLERFRASGISVMAFCARENVSVASYYYWARLIREEVAREQRGRASSSGPVTSRGTRLTSRAIPSPTLGTYSYGGSGVVRFLLPSGAEILVPVEQVDLIQSLARCLIENASSARAQVKPDTDLAFREVVVTS
jgi:hypothetical protein